MDIRGGSLVGRGICGGAYWYMNGWSGTEG